jgi:hypothetical protein
MDPTNEDDIDKCFEEALKRSEQFKYHAQFTLQGKEPLNLFEGMQLFDFLDADKSGTLTFKEVRKGCIKSDNKDIKDLLEKYKNTPLGLFLDEDKVDDLFKHINIDDDKEITMYEWKKFLIELIERDLEYIREKGLGNGTAYWGRKEPESLVASRNFTWNEWWADFWFYECNNNGLLGIFLADPNNTLKTLERLNIEFCVQSWVLCFTAIVQEDSKITEDTRWLVLFVLVTLPTVFIRNVLLYCFRCPCLIRRHNMSSYRSICFPILEFFGHVIGFLTFLMAVILLIVGIILAVKAGPGFAGSFLYSWGMGYVYGFMTDLIMTFNPFVRVRDVVEHKFCCCMAMAGFTKWQKQRSQVLSTLSQKSSSADATDAI